MFKPALQNSFRAALMMIAASSLIGMTTIIAKMLGQGFKGESLHPLQVSAGRFGFATLTLLILLLIKRYKFEKPPLSNSFCSFYIWMAWCYLYVCCCHINSRFRCYFHKFYQSSICNDIGTFSLKRKS